MTPQQYLVVINKPGQYCLGISSTQSHLPTQEILKSFVHSGILDTGVDGFTIIGDTVMFPYVLLFDRESERLGFALVNSRNCVPSHSVKSIQEFI
jgi:hypothetical protein